MKNFIFLNYNINIEKIYTDDEKKYFFINDTKIYIKKYGNDVKYLDTLVELTNQLYYNNLNVYTFLLNNENKYYTKKDNEYIILLKVNSFENDVNIDSLLKFQNIKIYHAYIILHLHKICKLDILKKLLYNQIKGI